MSFDYRIQAGLYRQLDNATKRLEHITQSGLAPQEKLEAMADERFFMVASMSASSTYTHYLNEKAKVIIDGIQ
ncbi:hypothetical protein ACW9H6_16455 [Pseudomonas sp. SDO528_S397]